MNSEKLKQHLLITCCFTLSLLIFTLHFTVKCNQPKKVFVQRRPLVRNNILIRNDIVNFDLFYLFKYENNFGMSRPTKPSHLNAAHTIPSPPGSPSAPQGSRSHPKAAHGSLRQPKPSPLKAAQAALKAIQAT